MGFQKPKIEDAYSIIRNSLVEISSPMNDGFTASYCKQELYQLKCWLDDAYNQLPTFAGEDEWERDRVVQILKRK